MIKRRQWNDFKGKKVKITSKKIVLCWPRNWVENLLSLQFPVSVASQQNINNNVGEENKLSYGNAENEFKFFVVIEIQIRAEFQNLG